MSLFGSVSVCRIRIVKILIYMLIFDCSICSFNIYVSHAYSSFFPYLFNRPYLLSVFQACDFFCFNFIRLFILIFYVSCIDLPLFNWWQLFLLKVINDASSWIPTEMILSLYPLLSNANYRCLFPLRPWLHSLNRFPIKHY